MSSSLFDLDQFFIDWAWGRYEETTPWLWRKKRENVSFDISWKKAKQEVGSMVYKSTISTKQPLIVFQARYENNSEGVQNNRFTAEKETTSTVAVKFTKGFSQSTDSGISLPLPTNEKPEEGKSTQGEGQTSGKGDKQPHVSAGFGTKVQVRCDETSVVEQKQKWVVDTNITVLEGQVVEAQQLIDEEQIKKSFTMDVRLKGTIIVNIWDKKNTTKLIDTVQGNIKTIINERKGSFSKMADVKTDSDEYRHWVIWPFKGMMEIRYGVRQNVIQVGIPISNVISLGDHQEDASSAWPASTP